MKKIIITLDGPAGSGKTSTAKIVANSLNYLYIDTGAMYRAVALACLRNKLEINEVSIAKLLPKIAIKLATGESGQLTFLNGEDVSQEIRTPEVTRISSPISALPAVRAKLIAMQQEMGIHGGIVMDGRDIGTVVFPHAELKIFLNASIEVRAERRTKELLARGLQADLETIKSEIAERDHRDRTREISPLIKAEDAVEIDTSAMTIDQQAAEILRLARRILEK